MKKIVDMTPKEKAELLDALSKVQESNKSVGTYIETDKEADRVIYDILKSIK